jgi:hypothetical protein
VGIAHALAPVKSLRNCFANPRWAPKRTLGVCETAVFAPFGGHAIANTQRLCSVSPVSKQFLRDCLENVKHCYNTAFWLRRDLRNRAKTAVSDAYRVPLGAHRGFAKQFLEEVSSEVRLFQILCMNVMSSG